MNIKLSKVTANDISNMSKKEVIQYICDVTALNCFNTTYERKTYNHNSKHIMINTTTDTPNNIIAFLVLDILTLDITVHTTTHDTSYTKYMIINANKQPIKL